MRYHSIKFLVITRQSPTSAILVFVYKVNFCFTLVIKTIITEDKRLDFYNLTSLVFELSYLKHLVYDQTYITNFHCHSGFPSNTYIPDDHNKGCFSP